MKFCGWCGSTFWCTPGHVNSAHFCTRACANKYNKTGKHRSLESRLKMRGHGHPQTQETREKIARAKLGKKRNGVPTRYWLGKKWSFAQREQASVQRRQQYAAGLRKAPMKGRKHTAETRRKMSETRRALFSAHPELHVNSRMARMQKMGIGYISKGQYALYLETKKIYPDAELNFPVKTSSGHLYFADVCVPSLREIIEYDGSYWHKNTTEKDKLRDYNLQADGWKVRHVLESRTKTGLRRSAVN